MIRNESAMTVMTDWNNAEESFQNAHKFSCTFTSFGVSVLQIFGNCKYWHHQNENLMKKDSTIEGEKE